MVAAFTVTDPLIGIVCSLATAAVLTFCVVWVWRSEIDRRTKRLMLVCVFPVLSLLGRAYLLGGELKWQATIRALRPACVVTGVTSSSGGTVPLGSGAIAYHRT